MSDLYEEAKRALLTAARQEAGWRWVALAVVVAAVGLFHHLTLEYAIGAPNPPTPEDPRSIGLGVEKVIISQ